MLLSRSSFHFLPSRCYPASSVPTNRHHLENSSSIKIIAPPLAGTPPPFRPLFFLNRMSLGQGGMFPNVLIGRIRIYKEHMCFKSEKKLLFSKQKIWSNVCLKALFANLESIVVKHKKCQHEIFRPLVHAWLYS